MRALKNAPGLLLCFAIALPAWYLGRIFPVPGGPVIAILTGIIIAFAAPGLVNYQFGRGHSFAEGLRFTSRKVLQYSIILIGFDMNLHNILGAGSASLIAMLLNFLAVFITAFLIGKMLKTGANTTILIGVGTSICGGSAIAAAAPVIGAQDEEVSRAVSTIFLFNVIAVLLFPPLGRLLGMDDANFGIWAGLAINDTSSVVAAGTVWSNSAGNNTALMISTIVKVSRTLMIVPVTLALALYTARQKTKEASDFSLKKVFPWFVLFFIAAALVNTFIGMPRELSSSLVNLGKFMITMAMAAIGLNTKLKSLFSSGLRPLALGGICWLVIALVSLAFLQLLFT